MASAPALGVLVQHDLVEVRGEGCRLARGGRENLTELNLSTVRPRPIMFRRDRSRASAPPMPNSTWGLLRLDAAKGEARYAAARLPLASVQVRVLYRLMSSLGEFVPAEAFASWPQSQTTGETVEVLISGINEVFLRHCSGAHYVVHVPDLGYALRLPGLRLTSQAPTPSARLGTGLPRARARFIGHEETMRNLVKKLPEARLLTLLGTGGIGKTTIAVELARRLSARYRDGVVFVDLSPVAKLESALSAISTALEIKSMTGPDVADITKALLTRNALLVLDNCEHLIEAVAPMCESIFRHAIQVHVIATSREPLRCMGEKLHRLECLPVPSASLAGSAAEVLRYPSVQLLMDRIHDTNPGLELQDEDAPFAAAICRQLDGLPLAIELAAPLTERVDLRTVAATLEAGALSVRDLRESCAPRHRSLQHLLDWSHELLTPRERLVLARLSIFRSRFSLQSAFAIAGPDDADLSAIQGWVVSLAAKSLLIVEPTGEGPICRFLDTTRAFAFAKLQASGEVDLIARRHALHMCDLFKDAERDWSTRNRDIWVQRYGPLIDDVRSALRWSFGLEGDAIVGANLTVASTPLAYQLSLWDEYMHFHELAIEQASELIDLEPSVHLKLRTTLGSLIGQVHGPTRAMKVSYDAALRMAQQTGATPLIAAALDGVWMGAFMSGDYRTALRIAHECRRISREGTDAASETRTARMLAQAMHFSAQHTDALSLVDHLMNSRSTTTRRLGESSVDPQVSARVVLARTRWLQGYPDDAVCIAADALKRAESDVSTSVAHVIAWASLPVTLWCGDLQGARTLLDRLQAHCAEHSLPYWGSWADCFELAMEDVADGDRAAIAAQLDSDEKKQDMLATVAPGHVTAAMLTRASEGSSPWCSAEVMRAAGESLLSKRGMAGAADARCLFQTGLRLAREQSAWSWELRCATSLARLWHAQGNTSMARHLLATSHQRFTEGYTTADLNSARLLLESFEKSHG